MGVDTISILGDFKADQVKQQNSKNADVLVKYDMVQLINDANHFTEASSLVIYLAILNNPYIVDRVHVDEPFVHMHLRYHRTIYALKFTASDYPFGIFKPLVIVSSVLRLTASDYPFGNFNLLVIVSSVLRF